MTVCAVTGGSKIPITFPTAGYLYLSPTYTASTSYNAATDSWTTYGNVPLGATNTSTVSFITSSMTGLPANAQVRAH